MQERRIYVTEKDLERLEALLPASSKSEYVRNLEAELANAIVVTAEEIPPDVVTMNTCVRFEDLATGNMETVTLVYPSQANAVSKRISVLAPVGAALLGLAVGQTIEWPMPNDRRRRLRIVEVLYQPEASGDFHL